VSRPGAARPHVDRSAFAGFRFPPEVITVAVRWCLRYGLSYRDVEELLAERGIAVDVIGVRCLERDVAGLRPGGTAGHMARASSVNAAARRSGGATSVATGVG
jgi:hypothetical protein